MNLTQVYTIISEYPSIYFDSDYVTFMDRLDAILKGKGDKKLICIWPRV